MAQPPTILTVTPEQLAEWAAEREAARVALAEARARCHLDALDLFQRMRKLCGDEGALVAWASIAASCPRPLKPKGRPRKPKDWRKEKGLWRYYEGLRTIAKNHGRSEREAHVFARQMTLEWMTDSAPRRVDRETHRRRLDRLLFEWQAEAARGWPRTLLDY